MKSLITFISILTLFCIFTSNTSAQNNYGVGLQVGENMNIAIVPIPVYGIYGSMSLARSIQAGLQFGFVTGTSSGDSKLFDNVTGVLISPFFRIFLSDMKGLSPFFKVNFAYLSYSYTTKATDEGESDQTSDDSISALWGTFGLKYSLNKNLNMYGQIRFLDLGVSGKTKVSLFGISYPSVGIEFIF